MADPKPTLTFSGDVRADPKLEDGHVIIGGREYDLSKTGTKVRVVGPRDKRTCPICIRYVGRVFDRDDPSIQMFRESGAHPRCRHSLMPVGLPGLDREVSSPGLEHVEDLRLAGDTVKLERLYGKTRTQWIMEHGVDPQDLYRPDGTLWPLEDLVSKGTVPKSAAKGVPSLAKAKGIVSAVPDLTEATKEIAEAIEMGEIGRAANVVSAAESPEARAALRKVFDAEKIADKARQEAEKRRRRQLNRPPRFYATGPGGVS